MKMFVTGGTGFTGSHLVRGLLEHGHEVRVLDNQKGLFHQELRSLGADITIGSITDAELVSQLVQGCDVAFHLAAAFRQLNVSNQYYRDVNVEGTRNVAEACLKMDVGKLVYCSTQGVHGNVNDPPGNENSPIAPEDFYQYSKYEGERVVNECVNRGLSAITVRPTAIYGPGDPARFLMLFRMVRKGRFLMFGDGSTFYHPVHIKNLVDGLLRASAANGQTNGRAYLIADEKYWTLEELVKHVARAMDIDVKIQHLPFWPIWCAACMCEATCKPLHVAPPLFRRRVNWFRQDRAFSIEKARQELGYQPRVGIEEGLAQTARWYRDHHYI